MKAPAPIDVKAWLARAHDAHLSRNARALAALFFEHATSAPSASVWITVKAMAEHLGLSEMKDAYAARDELISAGLLTAHKHRGRPTVYVLLERAETSVERSAREHAERMSREARAIADRYCDQLGRVRQGVRHG